MSLRERFVQWLEERPRCPWTTPLEHRQCSLEAGHRRWCMVQMPYGGPRSWYGINYHDGRYERRSGNQEPSRAVRPCGAR
jgi:hypothetical protein